MQERGKYDAHLFTYFTELCEAFIGIMMLIYVVALSFYRNEMDHRLGLNNSSKNFDATDSSRPSASWSR